VKLDIVVSLTASHNALSVLDELEEYCNAVDVAFVRKVIKSIGRIAVQLPVASRRCVDVLYKQIEGRADYAVEEATIALTAIPRGLPGQFESIIDTVFGHVEQLKEAKARAAAVWLIGEFCEIIEKPDIFIDGFVETFADDPPEVQLQTLTAVVKVHIKYTETAEDQLQAVLNEATKPSALPDIRNRALIYWRLLSADIEATKRLVFFSKKAVTPAAVHFEPSVLAELLNGIGSVAGVLHAVPSEFARSVRFRPDVDADTDVPDVLWRSCQTEGVSLSVSYSWAAQTLLLRIANNTAETLDNFALAINKNAIGASIEETPSFPTQLAFGDSYELPIPLCFSPDVLGNFTSTDLECALRLKRNYLSDCHSYSRV
jgi:hypothetical protein